MVVVSTGARGGCARGERQRLAQDQNRLLPPGKARREVVEALSARGFPNDRAAYLYRSAGLQAELRGDRSLPQRQIAKGVRESDRPPVGLAPLRRALGPALDGRLTFRRRQPDIGGNRAALSVCLALPRLG